MSYTVADASGPVFVSMLTNMRAWLDKAEAEKDSAVLVEARLVEDMKPLTAQYQFASDSAKNAIARLLGISRQTLYDILNEKQPVTATMALRLGKLFGDGPEIWLNMQRNYDLKIAERELGDALDAIPRLEAA